jgi:hypothetical protein
MCADIGLGKTAALDVSVRFLFGLEVVLSGSLNSVTEVIINNSLIIQSCVWFGVALLRA